MRQLFCPMVVCLLLTIGCGEGDNSVLISSNQSKVLIDRVDRINATYKAGECDQASAEVDRSAAEVAALPNQVDSRLRKNLRDWLDHTRSRIATDCTNSNHEEDTPPDRESTTKPEPSQDSTEKSEKDKSGEQEKKPATPANPPPSQTPPPTTPTPGTQAPTPPTGGTSPEE